MALLIKGDGSFQQSGPPQWKRSIFDLDTLRVPYRGAITLLSSFLDSLVEFSPSAIDPNMFLSDWYPDNHKQFPTVDLIYVGRKNGVLPSGKHVQDDSVLSASSNSTGVVGTAALSQPITVQYYGPRNSLTWISGGPGVLGPSGDVADPGGSIGSAGILVWVAVIGVAGNNYKVGDVLVPTTPNLVTQGTYKVQVTGVSLTGGIYNYSTISVTGPTGTPSYTTIPASGGSGTGATFTIVQGSSLALAGTGVRIISMVFLGADLILNAGLISYISVSYFHPQIIQTIKSEEVIPSKYWRNTKIKTRILMPGSVIFTTPSTGV